MPLAESTVRIFDRHVEKSAAAPCDLARKYSSVHAIGERFGFVAPRVLGVQEDGIRLERLDGIVSLRDVYLQGPEERANEAVRRAGAALAAIHANLSRDQSVPWRPPARFTSDLQKFARGIDVATLPSAVLHGDYSFANVLLGGRSGREITIIDPCPNFGSTFDPWEEGPVYLDVGKMLACLEGQVPVRAQLSRPSQVRVDELQRHFLAGYEQHGDRLDVETAHAFAFAVASAQFRRRFGAFGAVHTAALYNRFVGNFPAARKLGGRRKRRHG